MSVSTRSVAVVPAGSEPVQAATDDDRQQLVERLSEQHGFRLDAAHTPAEDAETVDHRGVGVGPDERVGKGEGRAVLAADGDDAREELEIHLVHDAGAGRDDAKVLEGLLAPSQQEIALAIALVLARDVLGERAGGAEGVDLHRVIDHEVGRHERVDALRIAARACHRVAHRREVDDGGHAGEILEHHAGGHEGQLARFGRLRVPARQRQHVGGAGEGLVLMSEHVLEQDLHRDRQAIERDTAFLRERAEAVVVDAETGSSELRARAEGIGCRCHELPPGALCPSGRRGASWGTRGAPPARGAARDVRRPRRRYGAAMRRLCALTMLLAAIGCSHLGILPASLPPPGREPLEGFGAETKGGAGGRVITIGEPTEDAVRAAFADAATNGNAIIRFAVTGPIAIEKKLPILGKPNLTIEGGGATLDGTAMKEGSAILDIRTNDVIVRDLRLRNGDDNLRIDGPEAYRVVVTHVSSTGSHDDGISIGYGAHEVTVQYSFVAGSTRSIYCKYGGTNDITLHHDWLQKGAIRSPIISGSIRADIRNVIVEDWGEWGSRFEDGATGNVVGSLFALSPHARAIGGKAHSALRLKGAGPVYVSGNVVGGVVEPLVAGTAAAPIKAPPVTMQSVAEMEKIVRARAGCLPRDAIDDAYVHATGWTVSEEEPLRLRPSSGK